MAVGPWPNIWTGTICGLVIAWSTITSLEIWAIRMVIMPIIISLKIVVPNIAIIIYRSSISQNRSIIWIIVIYSQGT